MMDVETLRNEYESLAAEFPELRHAIVVGKDENAILKSELAQLAMSSMGMRIVESNTLKTDARSHFFQLWAGESTARADHAIEKFEALAAHAIKAMPPGAMVGIPGAILPRFTVGAGDYALIPHPGEKFPEPVYREGSSIGVYPGGLSGIRISASRGSGQALQPWVEHLIATQVVDPGHFAVGDFTGQTYLLPWSSFHASALALPGTSTNSDDGLITIDEIAALACVAPKTVRQTAVSSRPAFAVEPAGRTPGKFRYSEIRRWAVEQWPARSSEFPETFAEAQTKLGAAAKP